MSNIKKFSEWVSTFIASRKFFYVVIGLFLFQATWIAFSNNYGSPHDEKTHVGLIAVYAQNASPFIEDQPSSYDQFGDVSRSTSYVYHYLMSFPYRFVDAISDDLMVQVVFLRIINIILVLLGILLFKRILDRLFNKAGVSNLALFSVVMVPVFVYVAAGVSYDNLMFLGFATALYLSLKLIEKFRYSTLMLWVAVSATMSLVKYAYLPLAVGLFVGLAIHIFVKRKEINFRPERLNTVSSKIKFGVIALVTVISIGVFAERYGGNVIQYSTPLPDCSEVLSKDRCSAWGPWQRNELARERNEEKDRVSTIKYATTWVQKMQDTSFGVYRSSVTKQPLPIFAHAGWAILILVAVLTALNWKYVIKNKGLLVAVTTSGLYVAVLFYTNYKDYTNLGIPVAIQGRYLILLLPLMFGSIIFFVNRMLASRHMMYSAFVLTWMVIFIHGGLTTYLVRTDATWWWPNDTVKAVNQTTQSLVKPIIFEGGRG